jgi:hypothetical protein
MAYVKRDPSWETKRKDARRHELILQVLVNGGIITKEEIEQTTQYEAMYRLSAVMWWLKRHGAVIRVHKDGRKVVGYELMNVADMTKALAARGLAAIPVVSKTKTKTKAAAKVKPVVSMDELKAEATEVVTPAPVVENEVTEITE